MTSGTRGHPLLHHAHTRWRNTTTILLQRNVASLRHYCAVMCQEPARHQTRGNYFFDPLARGEFSCLKRQAGQTESAVMLDRYKPAVRSRSSSTMRRTNSAADRAVRTERIKQKNKAGRGRLHAPPGARGRPRPLPNGFNTPQILLGDCERLLILPSVRTAGISNRHDQVRDCGRTSRGS